MPARLLARDAFVNNSGSQKRGTQKNGTQKDAENCKRRGEPVAVSASFCVAVICVSFFCVLLLLGTRPGRGRGHSEERAPGVAQLMTDD